MNNNNKLKDKLVIVADTREQAPYIFNSEYVTTLHRAIPAGDYSIAGFEYEVSVERKSLDDFAHSISKERKRFFKMLQKLSKYDTACVVVEASINDVLNHKYRSGTHPNSVLGSAMSIMIDYGIPVFFCEGRTTARMFVELYLTHWKRKIEREVGHGS